MNNNQDLELNNILIKQLQEIKDEQIKTINLRKRVEESNNIIELNILEKELNIARNNMKRINQRNKKLSLCVRKTII